jgi:DNA-binding NarL/FixJ family response regulator
VPDVILQQISISLIPIAAPVAYIASERVMNEMPKPLQVYIIEDSEIVGRLLASAIVAAGAEVSGCSADAETAIGDVFALQPDLIMIDIGLATGSGFDVLKKLQDHSLVPAATKVVLTNHADAESQNLSLQLGADRFFDKSSETSQALALISALAAERLSISASPRHSNPPS